MLTPRIQDRPMALGDTMITKITERAEQATPEEKAKVEELRRLAVEHADSPIHIDVMMTAPICAIMFLNHNGYNRGWDPSWSMELVRIMQSGGWRPNSQGYALYDDGDVADGAHRMGAQAVSGTDLKVVVYLGMAKADVATLDCGKRRTAADAATLSGVVDAKRKSEILTSAWTYEHAAGFPREVHQANVYAVAEQIRKHSDMLARALEIGESSLVDSVDPLLGEKAGARIAALLLRHGWPDARVVERLDQVQSNDFEDSKKDPLAVARAYVEDERPTRETIKPQKETGVIIKGMLLTESGALANNPKRISEIKNAAKHPPDPTYPAPPLLGMRRDAAE